LFAQAACAVAARTRPAGCHHDPGPRARHAQRPDARFAGRLPASVNGRDTIHFALDKYDIDQISADILRVQAGWLLKYPAKKATIEGHADERGTRDYNLALGERRANSAKAFLVSLGVDASRLTTVSYGKERPVDPASTEEAWAKNRRAVTVTID
jgi:peptidoglycan-associated lipoprotein